MTHLTFTERYEIERKESADYSLKLSNEILSLKNDNKILKSALYKTVKRLDDGDCDEFTLQTISAISISALKAT